MMLAPHRILSHGLRAFFHHQRCFSCGRIIHSGGVRVRFAPSPTGMLHLGGLRTALYNFLFAKSQGGKFILRIEDTDQTRLVPGAMEKLVEMLEWSGIVPDEGPLHGGDHGPYIQSQRSLIYKDNVQKLLENGTAYHCFCTPKRLDLLRKEALRRREVPKYDNRCRHLSPTEVEEKLASKQEHVIRFKLEHYTEPWQDMVYGPIITDVASIEGDPVILKSDGLPTYHLANVIDDHLMGVTHILRGLEWQVSTTKHLLMYQAFGWKPPKIGHLPLLLNRDGSKLSKRQNDIHVEYFKNKGYYPDAVLNLLTSMGSGFKVRDTSGMTLEELVDQFDLAHLHTNSTRVDPESVADYNKLHIQKKVKEQPVTMATEVRDLIQKYFQDRKPSERCLTDKYITDVMHWCQDRISTLQDLMQPELGYIWFAPSLAESLTSESFNIDIQAALEVTLSLLEEGPISEESLPGKLKQCAKQNKFKYPSYMKLLRTVLSGLKEGPSVAEMINIIGQEETIARIQTALDSLQR